MRASTRSVTLLHLRVAVYSPMRYEIVVQLEHNANIVHYSPIIHSNHGVSLPSQLLTSELLLNLAQYLSRQQAQAQRDR